MSTRHLVHPELRDILELLPQRRYTDESLPQARAELKALADALPPLGSDAVLVEAISLPGIGNAPAVGGLLFRPRHVIGPLPAMLQIHGGGYINGSPELSGPINQALAEDLGCVILSVRYRLAPETPFPGGHDDCYAALAYLFDQAETLRIDPARIGISGESAGGGLAASTCLRARDEGRYQLAFQHLIYPMLDDRVLPGSDINPHVGEFIWTVENNRYGWGALIGAEPGQDEISPYCAPARSDNLSGLPPTFIAVGALDLFLEQDLDYARRLARAGVEIELHVYPGAFHAFDILVDKGPGKAFERDRREWLRRMM